MAKQHRVLNYNDVSLVSIDIMKEEISNDTKYPITSDDVEMYNFNTTIEKNLNHHQEWASIRFSIDIFPKLISQKKTKAKGVFVFEFLFFIADLKKYIISKDKSKIEINSELDKWITLSGYDSIRGILFEKLKNNFLDKVVLPLMSFEEINN